MDNPTPRAIVRPMDCDVIITGGGLNGTAMALAASKAGARVTLIDRLPAATRRLPAFDGRAYALALASVRMLRALGVWDVLVPNAQPIEKIVVSDGRLGEAPSPFTLSFDGSDIDNGPMGHLVEDRHLRRAMTDALGAAGVEQINEDAVVAQEVLPAGIAVTTSDQRRIAGRLLIGCDGRTSDTATRAGISRTLRDYDQDALVCCVAHEKPHHGTAHQLFLPGGPLAILPLTKNRSSIVWSENRTEARRIAALDDAGFLDALRPRFGSFLGKIDLVGGRHVYPLEQSLAARIIGERVALVGDAAHAVHPLAGQGLNAGLRDSAALADVLRAARRRGEDIGTAPVLDRYARWRRFDTTTLATATHGFNWLFSNDIPFLRAVRDLGMGAVDASPAARRAAVREAAGINGDLPWLMQ